MDYIIRFIIMISCGIFIPYIAKTVYEPLKSFNEFNTVEKILWGSFYFFIVNWIVITPSIIFFECFKYVFIK